MNTSKSRTRRSAHSAKVTARSAQASGIVKCYVHAFERPGGETDFHLLEKSTRRRLRILSSNLMYQHVPPLSNLFRDCVAHGRGLVDPWGREEFIAVTAPIFTQNAEEIMVVLDGRFSVSVNITTAKVESPPVSVWCYIEEYSAGPDGTLGLRLREKTTGRKVEMYGSNKRHLTTFLASPQFTGAGAMMSNLYEKEGFQDYVLVSGGTAVDSYDVLLFDDNDVLTYLLGPSPDTAYRDAFRALNVESPANAHARTARSHFEGGHYRPAILAARLAVETACGGRSKDVKARLVGAPQEVTEACHALYNKRHVAVHEGDTRVEQPDAAEALRAMQTVLDHLNQANVSD